MYPMRPGISLFQDSALATFPLWGHLMFPRPTIPLSAESPAIPTLITNNEVTLNIIDGKNPETPTSINLRPLDSLPLSSLLSPSPSVPGLLLLSFNIGSSRFAIVICTREHGFENGVQIKFPPTWYSVIREDPTTANVEGTTVCRRIFCGDEIVMKPRRTASRLAEIKKKEPLNLSVESPKATTEAKGYSCERCGKVFSYSYYRDKHLKYTRCVDNGDRKFPCPICPRSFEKRDRLRIHILHVHENHRPHCCSVCGKAFSQSSSLNKHLRVHSGERPYKCPFCPKAFTASSILRTHIRQHSGEKPFKCVHCGKPFASHAAHDSHVRRTHEGAKE